MLTSWQDVGVFLDPATVTRSTRHVFAAILAAWAVGMFIGGVWMGSMAYRAGLRDGREDCEREAARARRMADCARRRGDVDRDS